MVVYHCENKCCTIEQNEYNRHRRDVPRRYILKAGVFVFDPGENRVLLVQSRGCLWGPPKGTLERGETVSQCAVRELREETGIEITPREFSRGVRIRKRLILFYVEKQYFHLSVPIFDGNDANGLTWIKIPCLLRCIERGQIMISHYCRIALKRFCNIDVQNPTFTVVRRRSRNN